MSDGVIAIPRDIWLSVLQHLQLKDGLSLCLTCQQFSLLLEEPTFWIYALRERRTRRPIACALHENLSRYSLLGLKWIARHTLRLSRNWSAPKASPVGSPRVIRFGQSKLDMVFQVPSAPLYILHSRITRRASCWHSGLGRIVGAPIDVAEKILDVSPGRDDPDSFSMGILATGPRTTSIVILTVEYTQDCDDVSLSVTFRKDIDDRHWLSWGTFWTDDVIGIIRHKLFADAQIDILGYNTKSGKEISIETDIPQTEMSRSSGTTTIGGELLFIAEDMGESSIYHCPESLLRAADSDASVVQRAELECFAQGRVFDLEEDLEEQSNAYGSPLGLLSSTHQYGVPALSVHNVEAPLNGLPNGRAGEELGTPTGEALRLRFWTVGADSASLVPQPAVTIPGSMVVPDDANWRLMLFAHSGRHAIMLLDVGLARQRLQLASFDAEDGCSTHELEVPACIDLSLVYGLGIDDHLGTVALLVKNTEESWMYEISYA